MIKEWRDVVGYEGLYKVSNRGEVYSLRRKKPMKLNAPPLSEFLQVGLTKHGKTRTIAVHRLVAEAFHGQCPKEHEVDHVDNNQHNNAAENLAYVTKGENNLGVKRRQLSQAHKREIARAYFDDDLSVHDLARRNGVSIRTVRRCISSFA